MAERELARGRLLHEQGALPDSGRDEGRAAHELAAVAGDRDLAA